MDFILGVDGGNTKTDYFLFDTKANFIGMHRSGTCSHEGLKDSYEGSFRIMNEHLNEFLPKYNLTPENITAAVFGLAGVDTPIQKQNIEEVVSRLGFKNFRVVNDSFLGIKAGTPNGYGVCSINGTGTSSGGIDKNGNYLQVGGIGAICGDEAGGYHLARRVVRAVYDEAYRFGENTSLTPIVFELLGVEDKYYLMEKISEYFLTRKVDYTTLTIALFDEANKRDKVALKIIDETAEQLARSAGGVVMNLEFDEPVEVVLAGSVWVKASCPELVKYFRYHLNNLTETGINTTVLTVPPATGAVIWALELFQGQFPDQETRDKIIEAVTAKLELF